MGDNKRKRFTAQESLMLIIGKKKSTDNSVSVAYHKVTLEIMRESSYDIVNKECYEKDCSKETSSNQKILNLHRK